MATIFSVGDLLNGQSAECPQGPRSGDLVSALNDMFCAYVKEVRRLNSPDWISRNTLAASHRIENLSSALVEALSHSLHGRTVEARKVFDAAISDVRFEIDHWFTVPLHHEILQTQYRVRSGGPSDELSWQDLFHIPFDLNHKVRPQRYSVPGVPMLYLGSSLLLCWEEMGRPDHRTLWASGFRLRKEKNLKLLSLAYRPGRIGGELKTTRLSNVSIEAKHDRDERWLSLAILWPLLAACSYRAKYRGEPFVPEYVLPQLLMNWVTDHDEYLGVRYFSTRTSERDAGIRMMTNLALPAREYAPTGYCRHLSELFEVSKPFSWISAEALGLLDNTWNHVKHNDFKMAESRDVQVSYAMTAFGRMESVIESFGW